MVSSKTFMISYHLLKLMNSLKVEFGIVKEAYKSKIYNGTKPTSNNEAYFISAAKYRVKWAPFFDMMDRFVKVGNPDQSFWGGTYVGLMRLRSICTRC